MHKIFKIDQKSLSKFFVTSKQTFNCSKSIRETPAVDLNSEHNLHYFIVFLLPTLNWKCLFG